MPLRSPKLSPLPASPSTITPDKYRYDDSRSLRSLDLEEAKAMLHDSPELDAFTEPSHRNRVRRWMGPCSLILNAILFCVLLFTLANPCYFSERRCEYRRDGGLKLMSEEHGFVPEFKTEKVTFMNDSNYGHNEMFSTPEELHKILDNWEKEMPVGRGFVSIPNAATSQLPRPYHLRSNPKANGYSIANFHQYHCLWMIMRGYGNAVFNVTDANPDHLRHVTHCFDYLRQSVLCAGDSALEGKSASMGGMTDGWGNVHVCKKLDEQVGWIVENRLSDFTGIH
ncbi:hypothetical protein BT63DRAFT_460503 [Microthyrium microscopicum]|uniref:Oxidase ustYa n=1 Tax=Microthyrium microscopicum TaxID=703497 RepID=A0A6A6TWL3_9PEZI|nr:hypothetical protein BT63DRAFT_460503 [Microthyrium microscopicum]